MKKLNATEQELRKWYEEDKLSLAQIGQKFGVSPVGVLRRFQSLGITRRGKREAIRIKLADSRASTGSTEGITKMYLEEKLSCREIGMKLGISRGAVHYYLKDSGIQLRNHADGLKTRYPKGRFGKDASNWKGGKVSASENGAYLYIHKPDHPNATKQGYVMEHRLVMEAKLGRYLKPGEIVHHINGNGKDNRPENLEVISRSEHVHNHFAHGRDVMKMEETIKLQAERIRQLEHEVKDLKAKVN